MGTLKITAFQMAIIENNISKNFLKIKKEILKAKGNGTDLIVFPEASLSGYEYDSLDDVKKHSFTLENDIFSEINDLCIQNNIYAIIGFFEACNERIFNTIKLFGTKEDIKYRKIHLPILGADRFCTNGDIEFPVFSINDIKIGLNTCYDQRFPESARICTLKGAQIVITPTNEPLQAYKLYSILTKARAYENKIYYLWVNRVGKTDKTNYFGKTTLVDPDGEEIFVAGDAKEESLNYTLTNISDNKATIFKKGEYEIDIINHRVPSMYTKIIEK